MYIHFTIFDLLFTILKVAALLKLESDLQNLGCIKAGQKLVKGYQELSFPLDKFAVAYKWMFQIARAQNDVKKAKECAQKALQYSTMFHGFDHIIDTCDAYIKEN